MNTYSLPVYEQHIQASLFTEKPLLWSELVNGEYVGPSPEESPAALLLISALNSTEVAFQIS